MLKMNKIITGISNNKIITGISNNKIITGISNKISDKRMDLEMQTIGMFYQGIMKEDNVSWDEAVRLCEEEPKYSLGLKMQIYVIRASTQPTKKRKHEREFIESLSPEEKAIYDAEVAGLPMTKMVWDEYRRRTGRA